MNILSGFGDGSADVVRRIQVIIDSVALMTWRFHTIGRRALFSEVHNAVRLCGIQQRHEFGVITRQVQVVEADIFTADFFPRFQPNIHWLDWR